MTESWDVVVVGAGPAGAAAALAALRTDPALRVLLLDRADFPRDKSCGDGIAPHVLDVLRPWGAADVVAGWRPLEQLELHHGAQQVRGRMARPVHVVPRTVFDERLVRHAVAAGARLEQHRVRRVESGGDHLVLDDTLSARVVVGADGAHSEVRAALGLSATRRGALAIRGYAPTHPSRAGRQVIRYGTQARPAYAWAFDRGDGWSNIGYGELAGDHGHPTRTQLLDQLDELLPGAALDAHSWRGHQLPLSGWRWGAEQPDGPALLAGDAAGLVNPMTGEGIYYAVLTGVAAGRAATTAVRRHDPAAAGALHRRLVGRLLRRHLRHTCVAARLSRHPAVLDAGITAARRDRVVFDALVELGLGGGRITPRLAAGLATELATGLTDTPWPARLARLER